MPGSFEPGRIVHQGPHSLLLLALLDHNSGKISLVGFEHSLRVIDRSRILDNLQESNLQHWVGLFKDVG